MPIKSDRRWIKTCILLSFFGRNDLNYGIWAVYKGLIETCIHFFTELKCNFSWLTYILYFYLTWFSSTICYILDFLADYLSSNRVRVGRSFYYVICVSTRNFLIWNWNKYLVFLKCYISRWLYFEYPLLTYLNVWWNWNALV